MFLHLGGEVTILQSEVMGIFNIDITKTSAATKEFLEITKNEKKIIYIGDKQEVKSFIITNDYVFLSPISSVTLQKRNNTSFE